MKLKKPPLLLMKVHKDPMAFMVYVPLESYESLDYDYKLFGSLLDAQNYIVENDLSDKDIIPLYARSSDE